jgi:hypothetical protein
MPATTGCRTLPVPVRGDLEIVGEDDGPGGEFGLVDLLELPHRGGGAVGLVGRLIGELEEVDELGRVAVLLPRGVDPGSCWDTYSTNSVMAALTLSTASGFTW